MAFNLPPVTRSLSKKLSEEPFKVPYPVASTASTSVGEVWSKITLNFSIFQFSRSVCLVCILFVIITIIIIILFCCSHSLFYTATWMNLGYIPTLPPNLPSIFLSGPSPSCLRSPCPTLAYWYRPLCCETVITVSPENMSWPVPCSV